MPDQIAQTPRTLRELAEGLGRHGDAPAVIVLQREGATQWSFAQLADHVERLARGLAAKQIGRDKQVALLAQNRPEWVVAALAVMHAGATAVPVDVQFADEMLAHVLRDSDACCVFTDARDVERLDRLKLQRKPEIFLLDADEKDPRSWRQLLANDEKVQLPQIGPDDIATLFYTSGTTGPPKGVPLSHANLAFQLDLMRDEALLKPDDRLLLPLPLHHVYPYVMGMLAPLDLGRPIVLPQALTGPQLIRAIREGEVTAVLGVPRLYRAMLSGIESRAHAGLITGAVFDRALRASMWVRKRLGLRIGKLLLRRVHREIGAQLRVMSSGGAALDPEIAWKLEALGWQVAEGYGLTETAPLLTLNPPGEAKFGTVGRPVRGVEIRIDPSVLSEEARQKQPGQGEIQARGPNIFKGYRNLSDKTREAFTEDGWFRTGDLGFFDEKGYLHVVGRVSTIVKTAGGEFVDPQKVEEAYARSEMIREVGLLQADGKLAAVIVPERGAQRGGLRRAQSSREEESSQAVREAMEQQSGKLPSYHRVGDYVTTTEALPRTRIGKIRRQELKQLYDELKQGKRKRKAAPAKPMTPQEMSADDRGLLENPAAQQTWDWLTSRHPDVRITPDTSPQLELGIDSMEWLNLTLELGQRTGVELTDEAIGRIETVRDLLREVAEQGEQRRGGGRVLSQQELLERPEEALSEDERRWLRPQAPLLRMIAQALYALNALLCRTLFRLRVEGREHIPRAGEFVLAPNHRSYLDPVIVAAALGARNVRQTYWGGWTGIGFATRLGRTFGRLARVIPVDARRGVVSSLALGAAVLKRRWSLIWFPEGEVTRTGHLQPFRPGIGLLLHQYPVPIVPVFVRGTEQALPPDTFRLHLRPVTVRIGPPLDPRDLEREGEGEKPEDRIAQALQRHVAELSVNGLGNHQERSRT